MEQNIQNSNLVDNALQPESSREKPLMKINFIIMIVAAVMIIVGFALMAGAPSTETEFNPDIFSTRRIVVGPLISFLGFVAMGVGIIWHKKD